MYRIRLASGAETTFNSMDEFATALQSGTVTGEALIYHQRADRWLAVTNHPHYQIALSRPSSAVATADASKRQVISAVRPAPEVPATRVAPQPEAPPVATQIESKARKLTIPSPAPRKSDAVPFGAQENEQSGIGVNGSPKTTVLPIRSTPQPAKPPVALENRVPDLGEGLDLVEEIVESAGAARPSTATPQVDKLLEMLEPVKPAPAAPRAVVRPDQSFELLDLNEPMPKVAPLHLEAVAPAPASHEAAHHHVVTHRRRKQNSTRVMGIAVAAVVVTGLAVFLWKPWSTALPEGSDIASTTLPRTEAFGGSTSGPAPASSQGAAAETPTSAPVPAAVDSGSRAGNRPADSAPSIVRIAAPRNIRVPLPTANLIATGGPSTTPSLGAAALIQHYNTMYNDARSELELRMLQIGFTQIFLRSRLTTSAGVQDTRRLIASANSALRQYRNQENQIERAYQDTVGVAGRNLGWTPRDVGSWNTKAGQKEASETLRLTNLLLNQMDSTFSLLAEQEGKYQVSGEAISFENPEAARQYGALRVWLNLQADKYAGTGDALSATLRQVVKAIGATRLPQERRS